MQTNLALILFLRSRLLQLQHTTRSTMVKEEPANDEGVHNARDGVPLIKWTGALGAAGNKLKLLLRKPEYRNKTGLKLYDDPELGKQWREVYLRGSFGVGFNNMKRAMIIKDMLLSSEKTTPGADARIVSGSTRASKKMKYDEAVAHNKHDDDDYDNPEEEVAMYQKNWRPNFMMVGPYKNADDRDCVRFGIDISGKPPEECQVKVVQRASSSQLFVTAPASKGWLSIDRLYAGASAEEKQTPGFWNCIKAHKELLTQMTGVKDGAKGSQQFTAVFTVPFKARDKAHPSTKAIVSNADGTVFLWITIESWVEPVQAAKEKIKVVFF